MKNKKIYVAPSILACNFGHIAKEIKKVEKAGADMIHVDVMDGHFVPNITIGVPVVKAIRKITDLIFDVHLMISDPEKYIMPFKKAGADYLTFHLEAVKNITTILRKIRAEGMKSGLSIKPKTPVKKLNPYLKDCDLILIMSVEPGFGGQSFIPNSLKKIWTLRHEYKFKGLIAVDGGINPITAARCIEAGADLLVAGTAIFSEKNIDKAIRQIRGE